MLYFIFFLIIAITYFLIPKSRTTIKIFKLKNYIFPCILLTIMLFTVIFSKEAYNAAHTAFMLWVNNVIPSLLPFFICIELLKQTNFMKVIGKLLTPIMRPIFNVPGTGAFALVMGITSGYPVGAKVASDLYAEKLCTKTEAERLISFTNSSGPLFIIGAIGVGMLNDEKAGLLLLVTHFLASITVGIIFRYYKKQSTSSIIPQVSIKSNSISSTSLGSLAANAIQKSISTILLIGGYILFFAVVNEILSLTLLKNIENPMILGILNGILEITSGIKKISLVKYETQIILPIIALILGFGGFSVHMQVASILSESNLSFKPYILGKTLQGIFAAIYTYMFIRYTKFKDLEIISTFNYYKPKLLIVSETFHLFQSISTITFIAIIICIIYKIYKVIKQKKYKASS